MDLKEPIEFETTFARYTATAILGEGGSGRVYRATDESGSACAIKLLDSSKATREKLKRFKNELLFGSRSHPPHLVSVTDHGLFQNGRRNVPFYVMPLYNGSLRKLMQTGITPNKVLPYVAQLLDGVEAAHLQKVIHRDLKPENVLHDARSNQLVIADFGIARFEEEELYTLVETAPNTARKFRIRSARTAGQGITSRREGRYIRPRTHAQRNVHWGDSTRY
ncbi:MAG TPA: protein kinase [Candidatus Tectomicrobia bacterium]|nr:protein kinase [Candidatus Tectomicrobia bacterium]